MNKLYFGLPLLIVLAFFGYYQFSYVPKIEAHDREIALKKIEDERARKEEERQRQLETQKVLIEESERRKAERLAREQREKELKEIRDRLKERFDVARGEIQSFERDVRRLETEIEEEQGRVERARGEQAALQKEKEFLVREYVPMAEANAKRLQTLLETINKVEEERARQAALAASANTRN
jgi:hypothetical protein